MCEWEAGFSKPFRIKSFFDPKGHLFGANM